MLGAKIQKNIENQTEPEKKENQEEFLNDELDINYEEEIKIKGNFEKNLIISLFKGDYPVSINQETEINLDDYVGDFLKKVADIEIKVDDIIRKIDDKLFTECNFDQKDFNLILENLSKINSLISVCDKLDKLNSTKANNINKKSNNLYTKKNDLKEELDNFNNKNYFYKKFNKKKKEDIEAQILDLHEKGRIYLDDKKENTNLIYKIIESQTSLLNQKRKLSAQLVYNYKFKIENENKKISEEINKPEVIESMNDTYIKDKFEEKLNTAIDKKIINEDDKEFFINYIKESFLFSRNYQFSKDFIDLSEEKKNKFKRNKLRYEKISNKTGIYYSEYDFESDEIFNNSYNKLLSVILSEKFKNEARDELLEIKNKVDQFKGSSINEEFKDSLNSSIKAVLENETEINIDDFTGDSRWQILREKLVEKKLITHNEINSIEKSIINKLYDKYIVKEEIQGGSGQEAIHIIENIKNIESINLLLVYIKNNKSGHTMTSACLALKNIINNFRNKDPKVLLDKIDNENISIVKNLLNDESYLNRFINNNEYGSVYPISILVKYTKLPEILDYQEKYSSVLADNGSSIKDIENFYDFNTHTNKDELLKILNKSIELTGEDKIEVLSKYQENFLNIDDLNNHTIKITEELDNFDKLFNLAIDKGNLDVILNYLEKFILDTNKNQLDHDYLKKFKSHIFNENYFNVIFCKFNNINKILSNDLKFNEDEVSKILEYQLEKNPIGILNNPDFPFTQVHKEKIKKYLLDFPTDLYSNYDKFDSLFKPDNNFSEEEIDNIFNSILKKAPFLLLEKTGFPINKEKQKIIDIFYKIKNSPSSEMKNISLGLAIQLVSQGEFTDIDKNYKKIENIFVKNNIPFVGKQFKVFEALHPEVKLIDISSPELKELHSNNARKLLILKDLLKTSFNSLNSNLENYLNIFKESQDLLEKFEAGESINREEEKKLRNFFNKINSLSENIRKSDKFNVFNLEKLGLKENLSALRQNLKVKENETIIEKIEKTFLNRVSFDNLKEALDYFNKRRHEVDTRNRKLVENNKIKISENDLVKGINFDFLDKLLDRGVYSPEFIGSETEESTHRAKTSDLTPWDTDLIKAHSSSSFDLLNNSKAAGFGYILLLIKDRGQFKENSHEDVADKSEDKLELFKTKSENHYGIRTGFGSTEIDALLAKNHIINNSDKINNLKFFIAKKGFYIPICDENLNVVFSEDEFDEFKEIFNGIDDKYYNNLEVSDSWRGSKFKNEILELKQTEENIKKISELRDVLYNQIKNELKSLDIKLHQGEYDDSVIGAKIVDTGSTSRGTALDNDFDFDFVIKYNDNDFEKINLLTEKLKNIYPLENDYESTGMRTLRFKSFKTNNELVDLDISFIKKSDSEELEANDAVARKYQNIENNYGKEKLLDVLTNIRYAKQILKENKCYKKGLTNEIAEGGLGGIGVETWILNNKGDIVKAFQSFYENAYENGELISFNEFKKKYKIFGAGNNIRGNKGAENFVYNMDYQGYQKMAELSKKFK